jgi:hypothetical protein
MFKMWCKTGRKRGRMMSKKPEKYSVYEILIEPFLNAMRLVFGYWYCEGCKKHHSVGTKKFIRWNVFIGEQVCSLHRNKKNKVEGEE